MPFIVEKTHYEKLLMVQRAGFEIFLNYGKNIDINSNVFN